MRVPDLTYFGDNPKGGGITYGEARAIIDDNKKLEVLKTRLDSFLISQVKALSTKNTDGSYKIWSPFPLAVMTLLSIETLGHIICDVKKIKQLNDQEFSKKIARPIYKLMDKEFSYDVSKKFHKGFKKLHGKDDRKGLDVYSDVIHKYQRNTFTHGYQAKGVYLSHELDKPWSKDEDQGFLTINPYLFWELFEKTYNSVFTNIIADKEIEWRKNALTYFEELLN